jgi:hypothetical protein
MMSSKYQPGIPFIWTENWRMPHKTNWKSILSARPENAYILSLANRILATHSVSHYVASFSACHFSYSGGRRNRNTKKMRNENYVPWNLYQMDIDRQESESRIDVHLTLKNLSICQIFEWDSEAKMMLAFRLSFPMNLASGFCSIHYIDARLAVSDEVRYIIFISESFWYCIFLSE